MTGRYFFVHLQKTAGTSLWKRLQRVFPEPTLYPAPIDGTPPTTTISVEHLLDVWGRRGEEIRIVAGHFPLCTTELLGGDFRTFTVLREPVERTLSFLRHYRMLTPGAQDLSLEEIYDQPERQDLHLNHMTKMLSLSVDEMDRGALTRVAFGPERLERAKERLASMDVVGVQDRFEEFCATLEQRFGWDLGKPVVSNRTEAQSVTESFRERIRDDNRWDVSLYEYTSRMR